MIFNLNCYSFALQFSSGLQILRENYPVLFTEIINYQVRNHDFAEVDN